MNWVLTDDRGRQICEPTTDKKLMRRIARAQMMAGNRVMIFIADANGRPISYSSTETGKVSASVRDALKRATAP